MTRDEAMHTLGELAADFGGQYRLMKTGERLAWAERLRQAMAALDGAAPGVPVTDDDVYRLRKYAKWSRGQVGLHFRNPWATDLADRIERYLNATKEQEPQTHGAGVP